MDRVISGMDRALARAPYLTSSLHSHVNASQLPHHGRDRAGPTRMSAVLGTLAPPDPEWAENTATRPSERQLFFMTNGSATELGLFQSTRPRPVQTWLLGHVSPQSISSIVA